MSDRALTAVVAVLVLAVSAACSGDDAGGSTEPSTSPTTDDTTTTAATIPASTAPEDSIGDDIGFIEVSARIGVGDDALVVALAVDRPTLEEIEAIDPEESPAWCSGSEEDLIDREEVLGTYLVRVESPALDATLAGAERFELRADDVTIGGDGPVAASFELVVDGVTHEVPDGELTLNETPTGGTFGGVSTAGEVIEGAFLCG